MMKAMSEDADGSASECSDGELNESNTDQAYFKGYENLDVHRLMLSDQPRTGSYKKAILENKCLFQDKIVMDIGAGTGILSLFAAQAGARKVYAIEASNIALLAREIVEKNGFGNTIEVSSCQVEDFILPNGEKVDILISEWMGFYLIHESMLDSVIFARDKFLKDSGVIFPSKASIYACPANMEEFYEKEINFWSNVYGYDFSAVKQPALQSKLDSPQIMVVDKNELLCQPEIVKSFDLMTVSLDDVKVFKMRFFASSASKSVCRGVVIWFDCEFPCKAEGGQGMVLSTGPDCPPTHWKQTVVVLPCEITLDEGDVLGFEIEFTQSVANVRHYNIKVEVLGDDAEHPVPCNCGSARCTLVKAFLKQQDNEDIDGVEDVTDISAI